ncbi:MAG: molecular chaperone DnaJ [Candidatus Marinimicrobia bacterium]|jgi:molecular chaperone DnaJ|nr:molecular chaperone DnaJ [Candidatus Neomarinimicrobiota bacterium]MDP6568616.1 molecular chaperone DnaJ [Candidatus Neomarinimicrobiota bacterium]|tara:strand:- start:249 stop:1367 length:1119 start_codon:yes stop_codon:yes gene_type:complete
MSRDYYDILEVSKDASEGDIKRSYRKLAMKYHPDRNPGDSDAEAKFKESAEAYAVLSDPHKRQQYDQFGQAGVEGQHGHSGFGGISMDDIFNQFGHVFGGRNPFEDIFGGGATRESHTIRGRDLRVSIQLDLEEVATGVNKTIKVKRMETCGECTGSGAKSGTMPSRCSTCNGNGQVKQMSRSFLGQFVNVTQCPNCSGSGEIIDNPCRICSGDGRVRKKIEIKVKVPAGVASGNYMTLRGEGNKGARGAAPGDMVVFFEENDHPYFNRIDSDVMTELEVSFANAALGNSVEVPTLSGKAKLSIPAGIQSGQILRMRGKGLPQVRGSRKGDQLVKIQVTTPVSLNKNEKKLFQELASLNGQTKAKVRKVRRR